MRPRTHPGSSSASKGGCTAECGSRHQHAVDKGALAANDHPGARHVRQHRPAGVAQPGWTVTHQTPVWVIGVLLVVMLCRAAPSALAAAPHRLASATWLLNKSSKIGSRMTHSPGRDDTALQQQQHPLDQPSGGSLLSWQQEQQQQEREKEGWGQQVLVHMMYRSLLHHVQLAMRTMWQPTQQRQALTRQLVLRHHHQLQTLHASLPSVPEAGMPWDLLPGEDERLEKGRMGADRQLAAGKDSSGALGDDGDDDILMMDTAVTGNAIQREVKLLLEQATWPGLDQGARQAAAGALHPQLQPDPATATAATAMSAAAAAETNVAQHQQTLASADGDQEPLLHPTGLPSQQRRRSRQRQQQEQRRWLLAFSSTTEGDGGDEEDEVATEGGAARPAAHMLRDAADQAAKAKEAQLLAACLNEAAEQAALPPMTWDRAMRDELGSLRVHAVWQSRKAPVLPLTVVTQLSVSRLSQLSAQCRGWKGPLSAAIYVSLLEHTPTSPASPSGTKWAHKAQQDAKADGIGPGTAAANGSHAPSYLSTSVWKEKAPGTGTGAPGGGIKLGSGSVEMLELAEQAVSSLHAAMERNPYACVLDVALVYEVVSDSRAATLLYPVNQLRNVARLQATTELIAQLDVDMLLSSQMGRWLEHGNNSMQLMQACRNKNVFVLPAFETHGRNASHSAILSDKLSMQSKRTLADTMAQHLVTHFDAMRFPIGHSTTNFTRWFATNETYYVHYTYRYEPWLVVHRTLTPWHDVRFRGYGNNKIQQVSHINATGHRFQVHPVGFIIHRAHAVTEARKQLMTDLSQHSQEARKPGGVVNKHTLYGHTKAMFEAAKDEMDRGTFRPVVDAGTLRCSSTLPWYGTQAAS